MLGENILSKKTKWKNETMEEWNGERKNRSENILLVEKWSKLENERKKCKQKINGL